jgi:hypothetical protein
MGLEAVANRLENTALEAAAEILLDRLLLDYLRNVLHYIAHFIRLQLIAVGKLVLVCIRIFLRPTPLAARLLRLQHLLQPLHLQSRHSHSQQCLTVFLCCPLQLHM